MKHKINDFFKSVFSTKKTKVMFCFTVVSFLMLISVTFAWFISIIDLPNSQITTGNLDVVAKGYDKNGDFISTIITNKEYDETDPDMMNINAPLFEVDNWDANSVATCYISLENNGTINLDFSLTFKVNGRDEDLENLGGFWYRIEKLKNYELNYSLATYKNGTKLDVGYLPKSAYYDEVIKDYINKTNPIKLCDENCLLDSGEYSHVCTEHSATSRNLITLSHIAEYGSLDLQENRRCIYRVDLGFRKDAISERYTNVSLDINGSVYATQEGAIASPDGVGDLFNVTDEISLNKALENALPGDTVVLANPITYNGDLIINKCVNINTYGNDLTINGNLVYNYVSDHRLTLNLSSGGNIIVKSNGAAGGNLDINAPNSEVVIRGVSYKTNIYVEKDAILNATNAPETKGLFISGANIVNKDGDPKDIDIAGETRLTLDYGATLTYVEAVSNATNIEIINYGTIHTINLTNMLLIDKYPEMEKVDSEYAQIYIDNFNTITNAIQLPKWSKPFYENKNVDGYKEGNTVIIREWGALEMSILESLSDFKTRDIIDYNIKEAFVEQEVRGSNESLIVYYANRDDVELTIYDLLKEYFEEYHGTTGLIIDDYINQVKRLVVHSIDKKIVTEADLQLMNSMTDLRDIDLYKTYIEKDTIPAKAFYNKEKLTKIVLPESITTIKANAFANTGINVITIPANVTTWDYTALTGITYVYFNSLIPVLPTDPNNYYNKLYTNQFLFVEETVVEEYALAFRNTLYQWLMVPDVRANFRVFPKGDITDDGQHVVREIRGGYELICYTGTSNEIVVGEGLYLNGEKINILTVGAYCYSNVPQTFDISFAESVTRIEYRAFLSSQVRNIDFCNVTYIGELAFFNCDKIVYLNTKKVEEIDQAAFHGCGNIFEIECPELRILRKCGFSTGTFTAQISFYKLEVLETYGILHGGYATNELDKNKVRAYFYNDSFANVTYAKWDDTRNWNLKIFVKEELVQEFRETGCFTSNLVYPIGDIIGENIIERTTIIDDELIVCRLNLGEYVICGPEDNAKFICYNKQVIDSDYTVPSTATFIDSNGNEITKKITSVGPYAFNKVKIENINFKFGDNIKTLDSNIFGGHADNGYYNKIATIDFNNVEVIGSNACSSMNFLNYVDAPNVKHIKSEAFYSCAKLYTGNFPLVEEINDYAFYNCGKLFYLDFPSIKNLNGSYLFATCRELVSLKFGPNIESLNTYRIINENNPKIREIIYESDYIIPADFIWANYINLRICVKKDLISKHYSGFNQYYRELGYKVGDCIVTNTDGNLTYNLGEYMVTDVELYGKSGISISSFNFLVDDVPTDYRLPKTLNNKPVIRLGFRSFFNFSFDLIDTTKFEHGENFAFHENLLEIGQRVFQETKVRVSKFYNIKYIDSLAFYICTNMYIVNAPELLYIGSSGFYNCTNIYNFDSKKLYEVGSSALSGLNKAINLYTNIQVAPDASWMYTHRNGIITFATDPGTLLTGGAQVHTGYHGTLKLTNALMASRTTSASSMIRSIDDIILTDEFDYPVKDGNGNIIYTFKTYRYAINAIGDEVTIQKCLVAYTETDEFRIPGILDNRVVTKLGTHSFTYRSELKDKKIIFADSIVEIGDAAFHNTQLTGVLNLNNVKKLGSQAIGSISVESIIAPNVTSLGAHAFFNNPSLVSVYFEKLSSLPISCMAVCPKLKYVYTESPIVLSGHDARANFTGVTFVSNYKVESAAKINKSLWTYYSDITIYVPYESVDFYKEAFSDTTKYVNFTISPIGVVATKPNEITGLNDIFILVEVNGQYDATTDTYKKVYELLTVVTQSSDIIIPNEWDASDGSGTKIPITKINNEALKGQPTITNITLPKYLVSFDDATFSTAESLQNIYVADGCLNYVSDNGVLYTTNYRELVCYPKYHSGINYTVKGPTEIIRSYAFKNCEYLQNVIVGGYVEIIGAKAFEGTNLDTIKFTSYRSPIATGVEVFDVDNVSELIVYVPADTIIDYRNNNIFAYLKLVGFTE